MDKQPQNTKSYVDKFDIMQRYGVGQEKAKSIMRAIKDFNSGGVLGKGRLLVSEVTYWEERRGIK